MKKITRLSLLGVCLSLLASCGGYSKRSVLTCDTLNRINKFSINVPVYQTDESVTSFKFQDGYSMNDLKDALDKTNTRYQEYDGDIFIDAIVENKSEYFLIETTSETDDEPLYAIHSTSAMYYSYDGLRRGYFLIPYFLLADKEDYFKIQNFCIGCKITNLSFEVTMNYESAKLLYSQTDQKEIAYDDANKTIVVFETLKMAFFGTNMLLMRTN